MFNNSTPVDLTRNVINGNYGTITLGNITDDEVEKALKYLKPKRAIGPDAMEFPNTYTRDALNY